MSCYSYRLTDGKMKHIAFMLDPDNYVGQEVRIEVVYERFGSLTTLACTVDRNCACTLCWTINAANETAYNGTQEVHAYQARYKAIRFSI